MFMPRTAAARGMLHTAHCPERKGAARFRPPLPTGLDLGGGREEASCRLSDFKCEEVQQQRAREGWRGVIRASVASREGESCGSSALSAAAAGRAGVAGVDGGTRVWVASVLGRARERVCLAKA